MSFESNKSNWNPSVQHTQYGSGQKGSNQAKKIKRNAKKNENDEFSSISDFEEELNSAVQSKNFIEILSEFFLSIFKWILSLFGIKQENPEENFDKKI